MSSFETIRILIADDHQLFRQGVIKLIEESNNIIVVGEASNGRELITKYFELLPDVVLSDISMPVKSGTDAAKTVIRKDPKAKFLFLSMYNENEYIYSILKAGGLGLISKNIIKGELFNAIFTVASGKSYFVGKSDNELKEIVAKYKTLTNEEGNKNLETLTTKEKEVLVLVGKGFTSENIAEQLFISKRTVDTHRSNIMSKLNLKTLPDLMKIAVEYSLQENNLK